MGLNQAWKGSPSPDPHQPSPLLPLSCQFGVLDVVRSEDLCRKKLVDLMLTHSLVARSLTLALCAGLVASPAVFAMEFRVNSTLDRVDARPGDGVCSTDGGVCTLRAAIQESNASSGYDTVLVPFGAYFLDTIDHAGEDDSVRGDLDVRDALELRGIPSGLPHMNRAIITNNFTFDPRTDRLLDIHAGSPQQPVRIDSIEFSFGHTAESLGGGGVLVRAAATSEFSNCVFYANFTTGAPGVVLANYGTTSLRRCVAMDNRLDLGPALVLGTFYSGQQGRLEMDEVEVNTSYVQAGGAIAADGRAHVKVTRSHFIKNSAFGGSSLAAGGSGGAVWLAGNAQAEISNTVAVANRGTSTSASENSIAVHDQATLAMRHVSLFDFSIEAPVAEPAQVSLEASVIYDTAQGTDEHDLTRVAACIGSVSSRGNNRIAASRACSMDFVSSDLRPATLRANGVIYPAAHPSFSMQRVLVPSEPSDILNLPASAPCPMTDQLGAARPTPRVPGAPRRCDAGAIELPLDHLFIDGMEP